MGDDDPVWRRRRRRRRLLDFCIFFFFGRDAGEKTPAVRAAPLYFCVRVRSCRIVADCTAACCCSTQNGAAASHIERRPHGSHATWFPHQVHAVALFLVSY